MTVLSAREIRKLSAAEPPLIESWVDFEQQIQTNGFDLSLREVATIQTPGCIVADPAGRVISDTSPLVFDGAGYIDLPAGIYLITYNEIVHLPKHIMALGRPRSSLLRCGVNIGTAVWDAGYEGRSQSLLVVHNKQGFRLQRNARVTQLVFFELSGASEGYKGYFQGENIK